MARSLSAASQVRPRDAEYREVIAWYVDQFEHAAPPSDLVWEPVKIGPTWQYENGWILPQVTLGWRNLAWAGLNLQAPKGGEWTYTLEQARFLLWHEALDPDTGEFLFPTQVLQRLKGWGKDPLAVADSTTHICSEDAMFSHWDGEVPVGQQVPNPYVQIVGVAQDQIKRNTMPLFPALIPAETRRKYGIQVGKLDVWARGDVAHIEASTSSVLSIEGPRPTLVIRNETQNWLASNQGHDLAGAIEGNLAKSADGFARQLDICNAYRPGEDSVAERVRDAWEKTQGDPDADNAADRPEAMDFGLLYDSLEAPPDAPLSVEAAPDVVAAIRGDSHWLNLKRILNSIKNPSNSPSESRRKWYNQITAAEDAWADPNDVKAAQDPSERLVDGDAVVLFGDGSKSDDATALVACRLSDGFCQLLHIQQPRKGENVDRDAVDHAVVEAFERFTVRAFWFDPSHARDDDDPEDAGFWWPMVDAWARRYGRRLKCHPVKSGNKAHAVAFDMATPTAHQTFVQGCEQTLTELEAGEVAFARSTWLRQHLVNCKRAPGRFGVSVRKDHRESAKKIDAAVCLIGARTLRRIFLLSQKKGTPGRGRVIVMQ
jgi:bifunctional DNA-binding transcriptional regulator/antitoxin component of YhaV-PrlF toxin-antitoxin module